MANYQNRPNVVRGSDVNRDNGFELFQSQLDAFLQQEKAAIARAGPNSNESQHRLDRFINNLQHELDAMTEENLLRTETRNGGGKPVSVCLVTQTEAAQPFGQAQKSLLQQEKKQPATAKPAIDMPVTSGPADSGSFSRLIFRVLIGASCIAGIILWILWPMGQVLQPPMVQKNKHAGQSLPGLSRHEIVTDRQAFAAETEEPSVNKAGADVLAHPVVLMPSPKKAALHDIPNVKKTTQVKTVVGVRLKIAAKIGNIRDKPDRSGKVLFRLTQGAVVTRLGEQNGWFHVRLRNGTIAWAHRSIF